MGGSESRQANGSDQSEEVEQRSSDSTALKAACAVAAVAAAGAALLLWRLSRDGAGQKRSSKLMKAPGRNGEEMPRLEFENDPMTYFRDLRRMDKAYY